jgi:hypothetical protein
MVRTKPTFFLCIHPYSTTGPDGIALTFKEGDRLEGSDPEPERHPQWWAADGDPDEMRDKKRKVWAEVFPTRR